MATGAVVAGRGTFEPAAGWDGDHHDGVPIFIYSRQEPGIDISQWPLVSYVNDVTSAMTQAKEAAGEKNVLVHGAATAQLALAAGVLDELELHVIPVLFGQGRRLFDNLDPEQIELERTGSSRGRTVSPTCPIGSSADLGVPPDLPPGEWPYLGPRAVSIARASARKRWSRFRSLPPSLKPRGGA